MSLHIPRFDPLPPKGGYVFKYEQIFIKTDNESRLSGIGGVKIKALSTPPA